MDSGIAIKIDGRLRILSFPYIFKIRMDATRVKVCEKKLKTVELKLSRILNKINTLKLNNYFISQLEARKDKNHFNIKLISGTRNAFFLCITLTVIFGVWLFYSQANAGCYLQFPFDTRSLFRSPEDCSMCIDVNDVIRLANISSDEFEDKYAYTTRPVIVVDGTSQWKAIEEFNFKFFANFYRNIKMGKRINDCFYFAYKSGLNSLDAVFDMDEKRANLSAEPWYVGWSTCYEEETRALRQYYNRPYFLPKTAESDMVDWIFMGGPGQGAHMHVDSVKHMSWQAQVRGRKEWQLAPPPECLYSCRWITFTVEPGEILVVDTNRWYHKTNVLPGDISITIGAEYD